MILGKTWELHVAHRDYCMTYPLKHLSRPGILAEIVEPKQADFLRMINISRVSWNLRHLYLLSRALRNDSRLMHE